MYPIIRHIFTYSLVVLQFSLATVGQGLHLHSHADCDCKTHRTSLLTSEADHSGALNNSKGSRAPNCCTNHRDCSHIHTSCSHSNHTSSKSTLGASHSCQLNGQCQLANDSSGDTSTDKTQEDDPTPENPAPHDHDNCVVCQYFSIAQSPSLVVAATLVEQVEVYFPTEFTSEHDVRVPLLLCSRAPPA